MGIWAQSLSFLQLAICNNKYNMSDEKFAIDLKEKGNICFKEKNYEQAYKYYTQSIRKHPLVDAYSNRSATLIQLQRYEEALEDCHQVLKIDKTHVKSIQRKGKCLILMLKIQEGIRFLTDSIKPSNKQAMVQIIYFGNKIKDSINSYKEARKKKDFTKAKEHLNTFYPLMKNNIRAVISFIQCQARTNTNPQATKILKSIEHCIDQTCFIYWYLRAIISLSDGRKSLVKRYMLESIRYFTTKPLKEAEKDLFMEFTRQQMMQIIHKVQRSIQMTRDAVETAKGDKKKEAIRKLGEILELDAISNKQRYDLLLLRSTCYRDLKEKPKQLNDLNNLIRMQPNYIPALQARMALYQGQKKYEIAYKEAERLHKITSKHYQDIQKFNILRKSKDLSRITYYDILDIKPDATTAEIKRAFKELALIYHPDKNISINLEEQLFAKNKFKEIKKAELCLSDPNKRRFYDLHKCEQHQLEEAELAKASDLYQMFRGGGRHSRESSGFNSAYSTPNFQQYFKTGFTFQFAKNFGQQFSFKF